MTKPRGLAFAAVLWTAGCIGSSRAQTAAEGGAPAPEKDWGLSRVGNLLVVALAPPRIDQGQADRQVRVLGRRAFEDTVGMQMLIPALVGAASVNANAAVPALNLARAQLDRLTILGSTVECCRRDLSRFTRGPYAQKHRRGPGPLRPWQSPVRPAPPEGPPRSGPAPLLSPRRSGRGDRESLRGINRRTSLRGP